MLGAEATIIDVLEVAVGLFPARPCGPGRRPSHGQAYLPPRPHSLSALAQFPELFLGEAAPIAGREDRRVVVSRPQPPRPLRHRLHKAPGQRLRSLRCAQFTSNYLLPGNRALWLHAWDPTGLWALRMVS